VAVRAAQAHLACDRLFTSAVIDGGYTWQTGNAVEVLQREIDRGDVWYDSAPRWRDAARGLALIIYAMDGDRRIPLARWPTTIGGWQDERVEGDIEKTWKESPVGQRVVARIRRPGTLERVCRGTPLPRRAATAGASRVARLPISCVHRWWPAYSRRVMLLDNLPTTGLPGDFAGPQLAADPGQFVHELPPEVRRELTRLLGAIARGETGGDVEGAVRAAMLDAHARTVAAIDRGHGLILLRGVPVAGYDRAALAILYAMMGRALGRPMPQNLEGETITDIRDTGEDPRDPDVRLYRTRAEQDFHTDGADLIGLLCLQPSRSGGVSRVVSSVRTFQVVRAARPDLAPLLLAPWFFHIPGARARGLPEAGARPIVTFDGKKLETFYIGWYIRNAQGLAGVPPLDDARRELLALYEATTNDPALYLDMDFQPGDIQWLRNAFVLHKRTAYEDHPEPERKRHLLRLWLGIDRLADGMPRFPIEGGVPR
jgi:hypothetical protein